MHENQIQFVKGKYIFMEILNHTNERSKRLWWGL